MLLGREFQFWAHILLRKTLKTKEEFAMFLKNLCDLSLTSREMGKVCFIGSHCENDIIVEGVSARNTRIEKRGEDYFIKDLGGPYGTFLNEVRIKESLFKEGDVLRVGESEFLLCSQIPKDYATDEKILKSHNPFWDKRLQALPKIAIRDLPVLILGPSGTGKELISQAIHRYSLRNLGPVFTVNCSALTESLAESELFGHIKGSFTGATQDRKGAFEAARGGTLILDEIGDLPLSLQPKLLRALENKEIRPVGSDKTVSTDVRIVACTHQDLKKKIKEEKFRLDLYYRLNVIQISIPPLCQRMEDFEKILFEFAREARIKFLPESIEKMKSYSWPGNIRELKNFVQRAKALHSEQPIDAALTQELLAEGHLGGAMSVPLDPITTASVFSQVSQYGLGSGKKSKNIIKQIERDLIQERLIYYHGNQRRVSNDLGIPKSTLHDKIKNYKIDVEELLSRNFSKPFRASEEVF